MAKYEWNKEDIERAVKTSTSYSEVLRKLGVNVQGNNSATLKRKIKEYGIDITHFTFHTNSYPSRKKDISEYLVSGSTIHTFKLKEKLLQYGLKLNKCEICGCESWLGKPINCQLHHINGDNRDNRLENLQILCPNCHSQTDNYCGQANKHKEEEKYFCEVCGREIKGKTSKYCPSCAARLRKKLTVSKEEFINVLKECDGVRLRAAKELGVSETAIRKWCKIYGLPTKSKDLRDLLNKQ